VIHTEQWQQIQQAKALGRLPPALLLTGMKGIGKLDFARAVAQSLLAQATQLKDLESHPDLLIVKHEDAAQIKIEQIRALTDFVYQTSWTAGLRIVIMPDVHLLNANAANAFLKTLEEPAPSVLFLLITHKPTLLPATLRSRCQQLRFPASSEMLAQLQQAQQGIRQAVFSALSLQDPLAAAASIQTLELEEIVAILMNVMLDLLRLQAGASVMQLTNQEQMLILSALQSKLNMQSVLDYVAVLEELQRDLSRKINLNKLLTLERLFIHLCS